MLAAVVLVFVAMLALTVHAPLIGQARERCRR